MKKQIIEIDINKLNTDELEELKKIIYYSKQDATGEKWKAINARQQFIEGHLTQEQEQEYIKLYCEE